MWEVKEQETLSQPPFKEAYYKTVNVAVRDEG